MIHIHEIKDDRLDKLFQNFETSMDYVSNLEYPIKLNNYGYFLRIALNILQKDNFDYLLNRLHCDKELERNEGGYSMEDLDNKNPKLALKDLIEYLANAELKIQVMSQNIKNGTLVADREDIDFLKDKMVRHVNILTSQELKKQLRDNVFKDKSIVFYSFNGTKDFDFYYHLPFNVHLILYPSEVSLYYKQIQRYRTELENELTSKDRYAICEIKYDPVKIIEVKVNPTLEEIIQNLDERSNREYENYKEESDSILDDLDEKIQYKIHFSNGKKEIIDSNETVFNSQNMLVKAHRIKTNDKIRIYLKEEIAENLLQIAVNEEPEIYGKIDKHSAIWKNALTMLRRQYGDNLYERLKQKGLRVLPTTVEGYFRGNRKFPMYNSDLRAILELNNQIECFGEINKTKRLYNSTMIALGRGIKQEIKQFLQKNTLGEILQKKKFTKETLQKFIEKDMPLLEVTKINKLSDE